MIPRNLILLPRRPVLEFSCCLSCQQSLFSAPAPSTRNMSKIYLHYDGELGPDHTFIWRQEHGLPFTGRSLGEALVGFVQSYNKKHTGAYNAGRCAREGCVGCVRVRACCLCTCAFFSCRGCVAGTATTAGNLAGRERKIAGSLRRVRAAFEHRTHQETGASSAAHRFASHRDEKMRRPVRSKDRRHRPRVSLLCCYELSHVSDPKP